MRIPGIVVLVVLPACVASPSEEAAQSHASLSAQWTGFRPASPRRVLDTRGSSPLARGETRCVPVGVPGAAAVAVNVTATRPTAEGYLTLFGGGDARPGTSNVNFVAGETAASGAVVSLTDRGDLCIFHEGEATDVIVDVAGTFAEDGLGFAPSPPSRLLDTREGAGPDGDLVVRVPGPRAEAVLVNLTATDVSAGGYLAAYAEGTASPATSNLNVEPGMTRANAAFVALSADNTFRIDRRASAQVVVDLVGTFAKSAPGRIMPVAPRRAYDSRAAGGPLLHGEVRAVPILPPGSGGAAFVTVTAVGPTKPGYLTVGATSGVASTLNFARGQTIANMTATWVSPEGIGYVYNPSGRTHVIVDVFAIVSTPPVTPPPIPPIPPEPEYDRWSRVLLDRGVVPNEGGAVTVVGVRGPAPAVVQAFDESFVVLFPDQRVATFAGSTHPWFAYSSFPRDVDGDGLGDVGMIAPGRYWATRRGWHYGAPYYAVTLHDGNPFLRGWRNTDHDGAYSAEEKAASEARGDALTEILFHAAGPGSLSPIGCQVLSPEDMNALAELAGGAFDYVLVEGL